MCFSLSLSCMSPCAQCVSEMRARMLRVQRQSCWCLAAARRWRLGSGGHVSKEYRDLNRAVRSAIRRDTCDDVRRRIREEGRGSMWKAIRSTVDSGKSDRKLPDVTPDQLNDYFVGVGARVADEVRAAGGRRDVPCRLPRVGACAFQLAPLTLSELRAIVYGMSGSAACGEDGVSILLVRRSFEAIGTVFLHLVNSSISLSEVPNSWKHTLVFPIHKSGDLSNPSNFRSISIVPVIAKIVERAVHKQLYSYLSTNNLLSPTQQGFRPRHSTETALLSISDQILSANDRGKISLLCLLDLSKCFDVIDHSKLWKKLQLYGIDITWFSAYLRDHTQSVSFTDNLGNSKQIRSTSQWHRRFFRALLSVRCSIPSSPTIWASMLKMRLSFSTPMIPSSWLAAGSVSSGTSYFAWSAHWLLLTLGSVPADWRWMPGLEQELRTKFISHHTISSMWWSNLHHLGSKSGSILGDCADWGR